MELHNLSKNAKKEREYFEFLENRVNLINLIMAIDDFGKLNLENLKLLNEKVYLPIAASNPLLRNTTDDLHKLMSYVAYYTANLCPVAFLNREQEMSKWLNFVDNCAIIIDKCLNGDADVKDLQDYIVKSKIEGLKDACELRAYEMNNSPELTNIINNFDLNSPECLYATGKYVTENELKINKYFSKMPDEEINEMAKTVVNGFIRGYKSQNLDISKKSYVIVNYPLGFEKMAKMVKNLLSEYNLRTVFKISNSTEPNRQLTYFHKNDTEIYINDLYVEKYLENMDAEFGRKADELQYYGGPLWIETFGEKPFDPKPENLYKGTKDTKVLLNKMQSGFVRIYNKHTKSEERSFTIISYPCPDIGEKFEEIFDETVKINNLDCDKWQKIQQYLIDTLDKGDYVHIIGANGNKTNLKVKLANLSNPETETLFENCVADVNIPVGEVFTSPQLSGTNGKLYVSKVYLNGLKYTDLEFDIVNGEITNYNCSVFKKEESNKEFIKENILKNFDSLPMGEFAIGTNTLAYVVARKYNIEDKLDILIAEKTGPHFAFGDTCFRQQEDIKTFNPDGKEIVAKENDYSRLRDEDPNKAYFGCHTDITIPFDEIKTIKVICKDGSEISIIEDGLFVLEGTTDLNLEEMKA